MLDPDYRAAKQQEALENILSADDLQEAIGIAAQALEDPNE